MLRPSKNAESTISRLYVPSPFCLEYSLGCGQVFRWKKFGGWWYRNLSDGIVKVRHLADHLEFAGSQGIDWHKVLADYFRFDDDLNSILREISLDIFISKAVKAYKGLRLLRQDPWECIVSYICATNTNIPQIEMMIDNLCRSFGKPIVFDSIEFYTFPDTKSLAGADISLLRSCKTGYRAEFIRSTAEAIADDEPLFKRLQHYTFERARDELLQKFEHHKVFRGIGPKVADCVLLFSLGRLEAFPTDVWIFKAISNQYAHLFDKKFLGKVRAKDSLGVGDYRAISNTMRRYFGRYAGYAQEYIYHFVRTR